MIARRAYRHAHPLAARALRLAMDRLEPGLRQVRDAVREWLRRRSG